MKTTTIKILAIVALMLSLGIAQAQTTTIKSYPTSGGWFNFSTPKYSPTITDLVSIIDTAQSSSVSTTKWYKLPSGVQCQILHPQDWIMLETQCYQVVSDTVNESNLAVAIKKSKIAYWQEPSVRSGITVKNYSWSNTLKGVTYKNNFTGQDTTPLMKVIVFDGFPVMREICLNPLELITMVTTTITPHIPEADDTTKKNDGSNAEIKKSSNKKQVVPTQQWVKKYGWDPRCRCTGWYWELTY